MEELAPTGAIGQRRMRAAHQMTAKVDTTATRPHFWWPLVLILLAAALLRGVFPTADPPWQSTVGIVWHDEGAWVHNARNMALFGGWVQDRWNPLYVAPVFTGLEYLSFATFGVGLWQARLVSELGGLLAVALLACGMRRMAGRDAGLIAGALLATNYIGVMWDRAALLEASMVAFVVAAWYCYVRAQTQPLWGALAAACALLAFFTKAAAAFFIAAIGVEVVLLYLWPVPGTAQASRRTAVATAGGLVLFGALVLALFVVPHWTDYQFYNWQMSVTRKPSYDARSLLNRVTWFPIVHDIFTRLWFLVVVSMVAVLGSLARWRALLPPERLLIMWVGLGAFELLVHDVANERRFIFFIPALAALTALVLGRDRRLLPTSHPEHRLAIGGSGGPVRFLCRVYCRRRPGPAHRALRTGTRGPSERCAGVGVHGSGLCHMGQAYEVPGRTPVEPLVRESPSRHLSAPANSSSSGNGRRAARTRTIWPWSSSGASCPPAHSSTVNSRTGCRSKTASSLSSSAADSETTTTGNVATMCGIF